MGQDDRGKPGSSEIVVDSSEPGLLKGIWVSGLWRLFPFLLIYSIGIAITIPITPSIITNGIASAASAAHGGPAIDCQLYLPADAPKECNDAHATAVQWSSWTGFVSGSFLSFLCAPVVGRASDRIGRKPFMLIGIMLFAAPVAVIMMHLWGWVSIYWYYPASALNGAISAFHMCLVSVSDLVGQRHRAAVVGLLMSMLSIGILVGPAIGGLLGDPLAAIYVCLVSLAVTFVYTVLVVPECAPTKARAAAAAAAAGKGRRAEGSEGDDEEAALVSASPSPTSGGARLSPFAEQAAHGGVGHGGGSMSRGVPTIAEDRSLQNSGDDAAIYLSARPSGGGGAGGGALPAAKEDEEEAAEQRLALSGWQIIIHSAFYRRLALLWIIFTVNMEGAQVLLLQYLQLTLNFKTRDNALLLVVMAACGLVIKVGLMPYLCRVLGEQRLVILGLFAYCLEDLGIALAKSRNAVLGAVSVGSIAGMCWPVMIALQSSRVTPEQQGAVYGTMQGITALASGLGPVIFAALFSAFTRSDSELPFMPAIVWYISSAMMAAGMVVAGTLYIGVGSPEEDAAAASAAIAKAKAGGGRSISDAAPAGQMASMRSFNRALSRLMRRGSGFARPGGDGLAADAEEPLLGGGHDEEAPAAAEADSGGGDRGVMRHGNGQVA